MTLLLLILAIANTYALIKYSKEMAKFQEWEKKYTDDLTEAKNLTVKPRVPIEVNGG